MAEAWEVNLRAAIRGANGQGWTARRGGPDTTQLIYRPPHPMIHGNVKTQKQTAQHGRLHLPWHNRYSSEILKAATACGRMVAKGSHLSAAAKIACGPTPLGPVLDWAELVNRFKHHRVRMTGEISEKTWHRMHLPALTVFIGMVTGPAAPTTARAAFQGFPWAAPGSTMRKMQVQTLARFLTWSVNLGIIGPEWEPPPNKEFYGAKPKEKSKITGVLTDSEICELLDDTHHGHWWWLFTAMGLYGLRPEETLHLEFRGDDLWCNYRKRSSGGMSDPRRLYALEPRKGLEELWLNRFSLSERLPDLGRDKGKVGLSMNIYLRRQKIWKRFKESDTNRKLVPYSFRHAYALRGAARGIPPRMMAAAMGHTLSTHLNAYSKYMDQSSMDDAFNSAAL